MGERDHKYDPIFPGPGSYNYESTFEGKRAASFRIKTVTKPNQNE